MKLVGKTAVLLGATLIIGTAGLARAETLEVNVPFPFLVHGTMFPAGEYRLENEGAVVLIRGEKGKPTATFIMTTPASGRDPAGDKPVLTFSREEKNYVLTGLWESEEQGMAFHR